MECNLTYKTGNSEKRDRAYHRRPAGLPCSDRGGRTCHSRGHLSLCCCHGHTWPEQTPRTTSRIEGLADQGLGALIGQWPSCGAPGCALCKWSSVSCERKTEGCDDCKRHQPIPLNTESSDANPRSHIKEPLRHSTCPDTISRPEKVKFAPNVGPSSL
jgi:hypothetical protein